MVVGQAVGELQEAGHKGAELGLGRYCACDTNGNDDDPVTKLFKSNMMFELDLVTAKLRPRPPLAISTSDGSDGIGGGLVEELDGNVNAGGEMVGIPDIMPVTLKPVTVAMSDAEALAYTVPFLLMRIALPDTGHAVEDEPAV